MLLAEMAIRPSTVPVNAVLVPATVRVPLGVQIGSPQDPQLSLIAQFEVQLAHLNAQANAVFYQAMRDYQANAERYTELGMVDPFPAPIAPHQRLANVVWADSSGNVKAAYAPAADCNAWIWES